MRLKKILFTLGVLVVLLAPIFVFADQYGLDNTAKEANLGKSIAGASSVPEAVGNIISVALSFLGIVFFGLIFYAGIVWMIALGESGKVDKAKNLIETAIIGLIIVIGAYAISTFVFDRLVNGGGDSDVPPQTDCSDPANQGKRCDINSVCFNNSCKSLCELEDPRGTCMLESSCDAADNHVEPNRCPGAENNKCCVPNGT